MKVKALGSVLAKRFGVALAEPLVPWHPTLGDVDSAAALADYQASKKLNKAALVGLTAEHGEALSPGFLQSPLGFEPNAQKCRMCSQLRTL